MVHGACSYNTSRACRFLSWGYRPRDSMYKHKSCSRSIAYDPEGVYSYHYPLNVYMYICTVFGHGQYVETSITVSSRWNIFTLSPSAAVFCCGMFSLGQCIALLEWEMIAILNAGFQHEQKVKLINQHKVMVSYVRNRWRWHNISTKFR